MELQDHDKEEEVRRSLLEGGRGKTEHEVQLWMNSSPKTWLLSHVFLFWAPNDKKYIKKSNEYVILNILMSDCLILEIFTSKKYKNILEVFTQTSYSS